MKNILKGVFGLLVFMNMFFITTKVHADLIWLPEDSFFLGHQSDCKREYRQYIADGQDGKVTLYESPISHKKVAAYENGVALSILYTYTGKRSVEWGYTETFQPNAGTPKTTGWIHMDDLKLVYDNQSFCEEHESELKEYKGEFTDRSIVSDIVIWSYPESGKANGTIPSITSQHQFKYIYTDADNRQWVYFQYRNYKWEGAWICMSDPSNENIPATDLNQPTIIPASDTMSLPVDNSNNNSEIIILGIGVLILIAVTAILIRVFWKRDKGNQKAG